MHDHARNILVANSIYSRLKRLRVGAQYADTSALAYLAICLGFCDTPRILHSVLDHDHDLLPQLINFVT